MGARPRLGATARLAPVDQTEEDTVPAGFNELIGVELLEVGEDEASARVPVAPKLLQPFAVVHGGVIASLAETLTSYATWLRVHEGGSTAMGQANQTSFLRPISEGHVNARAKLRHRGRTTWVWDVDVTDDAGRLCAVARMTVAVRPTPDAKAPSPQP